MNAHERRKQRREFTRYLRKFNDRFSMGGLEGHDYMGKATVRSDELPEMDLQWLPSHIPPDPKKISITTKEGGTVTLMHVHLVDRMKRMMSMPGPRKRRATKEPMVWMADIDNTEVYDIGEDMVGGDMEFGKEWTLNE